MEIKVTYNIYEQRKEWEMSIRELSKLSGVSKSQINDIENGIHDATVSTLCMIAEALNLHPCDLFHYKIL